MSEIPRPLKKKILIAQKNELTEYHIYKRLAALTRKKENADVLVRIANEEAMHHDFFKSLTQEELRPSRFKIFRYLFIIRVLGMNFGLKLMEKGEDLAQRTYQEIREIAPRIDEIIKDETEHENELINLIAEERLKYIGSMVLGLNDALVEISGAIVGFSLALQRPRLVGIVALITGIAGALSMSAASYLAVKEENDDRVPFKAGLYTGIAYIATIVILILPYFLFSNIFLCLSLMIVVAFLLIYGFTFYISVAKDLNFKRRFFEMAGIGLGVAIINFAVGLIIRSVFGIDV